MKKAPGILILTLLSLSACKNIVDQSNKIKNKEMEIKTIENTDDIFIISHTFETDAGSLFNMWIDPEIYTSWMGPKGAVMSFLNADVREGGTALWKMTTPDDSTKYGKLHFKKINPNNQLVYVQNFCDKDGDFIKAPFLETYPDSLLLTADFVQEAKGKVKMTVKWEILGESTEIERKTFNDMKPYMVQGWGESFDKIEAILKPKT